MNTIVRQHLALLLGGMLLAAVAYAFVAPIHVVAPQAMTLAESVSWLTAHPADWRTAARVAGAALDSDAARRTELWQAADAHVRRLAPTQVNGTVMFVRAGLTHWYELDAKQREVVAERSALLLSTDRFYGLALPFYEATGRFDVLRHANPGSVDALVFLERLAATNGLFTDYRGLRGEVRSRGLADYRARLHSMSQRELIAGLPNPLTIADREVVQTVLNELKRRPLDANPGVPDAVERLAQFALAHEITPLDGLEFIALEAGSASDATRARIALATGDPDRARAIELATNTERAEWRDYQLERAIHYARAGDARAANDALNAAAATGLSAEVLDTARQVAKATGDDRRASELEQALQARYATPRDWAGLCGDAVCRNATTRVFRTAAGVLTLTVQKAEADEVAPYVEIYVDDTLAAEGDVDGVRRFPVPLSGQHVEKIEVRLVNPVTRNYTARRVRLS